MTTPPTEPVVPRTLDRRSLLERKSHFLQVAAPCNATLVSLTAVSNDAQVPRTPVYQDLRILTHFLEALRAGEYR